MRSEMTLAEVCLWKKIRGRQCGGLRFLRQYVMGQYILDFYCPAMLVTIEVDGDIHLHPDVATRARGRQQAIEEERRIHFLRLTNKEAIGLSREEIHARILSMASASN
jgi:very-short-patch-repair endonuclease